MVKIETVEAPSANTLSYLTNKKLVELQHEGKTILNISTCYDAPSYQIVLTIMYNDPFEI